MTTAPMGGPIKPASAGGPERRLLVSPRADAREQAMQTPNFPVIQAALGSTGILRVEGKRQAIVARITTEDDVNVIDPCPARGSKEALAILSDKAHSYLDSQGIHLDPNDNQPSDDNDGIDYGFLDGRITQGGLHVHAGSGVLTAKFYAFGQMASTYDHFTKSHSSLGEAIGQVIDDASDVICS